MHALGESSKVSRYNCGRWTFSGCGFEGPQQQRPAECWEVPRQYTCSDSTPVQTGTRKNTIFGNAPRGVETHPQDSDDFLVTSAGCQERSKGGQEWWKNKGVTAHKVWSETGGFM